MGADPAAVVFNPQRHLIFIRFRRKPQHWLLGRAVFDRVGHNLAENEINPFHIGIDGLIKIFPFY